MATVKIDKSFIQDFIRRHNIPCKNIEGVPIKGGQMILLDECAFNSSHTGGDARILIYEDGVPHYKCHHNSCKEKTTVDFIRKYEPDFYKNVGIVEPPEPGTVATTAEAAQLPEPVCFSDIAGNLPELAPELIEGILRQGHKMLLSGQSKAGKSFDLIELAIALASGRTWHGFRCRQTKVLYLNLEVDGDSFYHRVAAVCKASGVNVGDMQRNLIVWNLRGIGATIDTLVEPVKARAKGCGAIIIDPIYKVLEGDENSASDMAMFTKKLDAIAEGGASLIFCHHFGKATQSIYKDAFSRASGSGVFARDPDAIIAMSGLEKTVITPEMREAAGVSETATPFQLDFTLREFGPVRPVKVWFDYPVHVLDNGALDGIGIADGRSEKSDKSARCIGVLSLAFDEYKDRIEADGGIPLWFLDGKVDQISGRGAKAGVKTIRNYAGMSEGLFRVKDGKLYQNKEDDNREFSLNFP